MVSNPTVVPTVPPNVKLLIVPPTVTLFVPPSVSTSVWVPGTVPVISIMLLGPVEVAVKSLASNFKLEIPEYAMESGNE
jgi:hypothetical protein